MKRLVALLAIVVLGAAACTYGGTPFDPAALTIDGTSVSLSQIEDELAYLADNGAVAQTLLGASVTDTASGGYDPAAAARLLTLHSQTILLGQLLEDSGGEITDDIRQQAEQRLVESFAPTDPTTGQPMAGADGSATVDDLPDALRATLSTFLERQLAVSSALSAAADVQVSDEEVQAAFDDAKDQLVEVCVSHIAVAYTDDPAEQSDPTFTPTPEQQAATEAEAAAIVDRLAAGEDFAAVAGEVSDDTTTAPDGGALGCGSPSQVQDPVFAAAMTGQPVGEVGAPVATALGYEIILVTSRTEPVLEDYEDQIRSSLEDQARDPQAAVLQALGEAATDADVQLDPRFGTWDAASVTIVPPEGAADPPGAEDPLAGLDITGP